MPPSVSVVIPLHNKAPHIHRAVGSVLAQTARDFELIVVDDASTDRGGDIVRSFGDGRVRLVHRTVRGPGGHAARNRGIEEARADLIAFLDADDEWKPRFLETALSLRDRYPEAGAYATAYEVHEPDGSSRVPHPRGIPGGDWEGPIPNYFQAAMGSSPVWTSAVAVPRRVLDEVGRFPDGEERGGDLDTWLRIALRRPIAYSSIVAAIYHRDATARIDIVGYSTHEFRLVRTALAALEANSVPPGLKEDVQEYISQFQLNTAAGKVLAGDCAAARRILSACRTSHSAHRKLWWLLWSFAPRGWPRRLWALRNGL